MYMLDTNICIYIIKKRPPKVLSRFQTISSEDLYLSVMTEASASEGRGQGAGGRRVFLHPFPLWDRFPVF